jgi:hypothetical protein
MYVAAPKSIRTANNTKSLFLECSIKQSNAREQA